MGKNSRFFSLVYLSLAVLQFAKPGFSQCKEPERQALLEIKRELIDQYNHLSSWTSNGAETDCCRWRGVRCSNRTGHVTTLDLRVTDFFSGLMYMPLRGNISLSLLKLRHLNYLDFSQNDFEGSPIPDFHGSLGELRYLNFSNSAIVGSLSFQFANLSGLESLDLSHNFGRRSGLRLQCIPSSVSWLSRISSLKNLDLSGIDLSGAEDWFQVVNALPSLKELRLQGCNLSNYVPADVNSSASLEVIDLSGNYFTPSGYRWLLNFRTSITHLALRGSLLDEFIPNFIGNMTSLVNLDLSSNGFNGGVPKSFGSLCKLRVLDLSSNSLEVGLPELVSNISGCMEKSLEILKLGNNEIHGSLPDISVFSSLRELDLSNNRLNGSLPERFMYPSKLILMNLGGNRLTGSLSDVTMLASLRELYVGSNKLNGSLSKSIWSLSELRVLDASQNRLMGNFTEILEEPRPLFPLYLTYLNVANNSFLGTISGFCGITSRRLKFLDLSLNHLTGTIPDCLGQWKRLVLLNFAKNKLSGVVPSSLGNLSNLIALDLHQNRLHGNIPSSLGNCRNLEFLDLSVNAFSGNLPAWIGTKFPSLSFLVLTLNRFAGEIPVEFCRLTGLRILDLSMNNISGSIPRCINNFTTMSSDIQSGFTSSYEEKTGIDYLNIAIIRWKGREYIYSTTLKLLRVIDISSNRLTGEIPEEITSLVNLAALNLSRNGLSGKIPETIGNLTQIQSLDFSRNHLSGEIPRSISELSFLSHLDLSYNNLSGEIPSGTQIEGFNPSGFSGNPGLCGRPLEQLCPGEKGSTKGDHENDNYDDEEEFWTRFYPSTGVGFAVGFWGICTTPFLNQSWRNSYLRFLDFLVAKFLVLLTKFKKHSRS